MWINKRRKLLHLHGSLKLWFIWTFNLSVLATSKVQRDQKTNTVSCEYTLWDEDQISFTLIIIIMPFCCTRALSRVWSRCAASFFITFFAFSPGLSTSKGNLKIITSCAGGRHNMPPCKLTFDLLTLKVVSESRVTWATSVPILVFLGLSVLDLGLMYVTDRQTSDVRCASSLNASTLGAGHNNFYRAISP